jgi:hypothetical protein
MFPARTGKESSMRMAILMGALALAGCAASAEMQASDEARASKELAGALKGRTAGEPRDCISASGLNGPQIIDSDTLIYRESGRRIWVSELGAKCPGMQPLNTIVIELHGSQICRNDRFRVLEGGSTIPGPTCMMGKFTPYTKQ